MRWQYAEDLVGKGVMGVGLMVPRAFAVPFWAEKANTGKLWVADRIGALQTRYTGVMLSGFALHPALQFYDCSNQCWKTIGFSCYKLLISIESPTCFVEEPPLFSLRKCFGQ